MTPRGRRKRSQRTGRRAWRRWRARARHRSSLTSRSVEANESVDVDRAFGGRVGDARQRGRREAHCGARDATRARGEDRVFSMARDFEKKQSSDGRYACSYTQFGCAFGSSRVGSARTKPKKRRGARAGDDGLAMGDGLCERCERSVNASPHTRARRSIVRERSDS